MRKSSLSFSTLVFGALASLLFTACSKKSGDTSASRKPMAPYCPYVTSPRSFASPMTVTGSAKYQYRIDGNGVIPDGTNAFVPTSVSSTAISFSVTITGVVAGTSYSCSSNCSLTSAVRSFVSNFNSLNTTTDIQAFGQSAVGFYRPSSNNPIAITASTGVTLLNSKPIRYAEVRATSATGEIMQCAETAADGTFTMSLPSDGAKYTVSVLTRSANSSNSAYIMTTPTENQPYSLDQTVQSTTGASLNFLALGTGNLLGGAFNILDQIANAQNYLRTTTAGCGTSGNPNYFPGCIPVTTIPTVYTYWSAGVSPGVYYGISGPISFYLNGDRELYILGGENGDTTASDMDHYDNSVIVHEYGHFIEDQFGRPDSPGGSHNGNRIIDPRLAWGEGWANFFQAAVSGIPYYRDTKGYVKCGVTCSPINAFNERLDPPGGSNDQPDDPGEGNFREFSVSRVLYNIITNSTIASRFSEVWTAFNGTSGMGVVADRFKSIGRLHTIQNANSGKTDWSTALTAEKQRPSVADFAAPLTVANGCSPSSVPMSILIESSDAGNFASSNLLRNNDFYAYSHPGGTLPITLTWSGSGTADLDLYLYKPGYTYGDTTSASLAAMDNKQTATTSGTASVSPNLPAGIYMINVMAYTGIYSTNGTQSTSYTLTIGGRTACPAL